MWLERGGWEVPSSFFLRKKSFPFQYSISYIQFNYLLGVVFFFNTRHLRITYVQHWQENATHSQQKHQFIKLRYFTSSQHFNIMLSYKKANFHHKTSTIATQLSATHKHN